LIKKLKSDLELFQEKLSELRMENNRYAVDLRNSASDLKKEMEKTKDIQKEIYNELENNLKKTKEIYNKTNESFYYLQNDYEVIKSKFKEVAEFIKDIRFRKNLNEINMADLRKVANKINEAKPPNMGTGVSNPSFLPEIKKERGKKKKYSIDSYQQENLSDDDNIKLVQKKLSTKLLIGHHNDHDLKSLNADKNESPNKPEEPKTSQN